MPKVNRILYFLWGFSFGFPDLRLPLLGIFNFRLDDFFFLLNLFIFILSDLNKGIKVSTNVKLFLLFFIYEIISFTFVLILALSWDNYIVTRNLSMSFFILLAPILLSLYKNFLFFIYGLVLSYLSHFILLYKNYQSVIYDSVTTSYVAKNQLGAESINSNAYAELSIVLFSIGMIFGLRYFNKRSFVHYILLILSLALALAILGRGAIISILLGLLLYIIVEGKLRLLITFLLLSIPALYLLDTYYGGLVISSFTFDIESGENTGSRFVLWSDGMDLFLSSDIVNILLGKGFGTEFYYMSSVFGHSGSSHNSYISLLLELGLLGFVFFLIYILYQLHLLGLFNIRRRTNWNIIIPYLVLLVSNFFTSSLYGGKIASLNLVILQVFTFHHLYVERKKIN